MEWQQQKNMIIPTLWNQQVTVYLTDFVAVISCYHDFYPFIPGISEPTYTEEELAELNAKENTPVEYNGKKYTKYEATQRQRKLETTMRAQRQEIKLLKEGGASEDDLIAARARYRGTSAEYARFSQAMDLPQQRERVTIDGLGNIGQGKYTLDKSGESGIIEEKANKPISTITDKAIDSVPMVDIPGYSSEESLKVQQEHKDLLLFSREENNNGECAFTFRDGLSDRKEFIGSDDYVNFGNDGLNGKDIFVMHNHPRNSSYSDRDVKFLIENENVKALSIVKNNGHVEILIKNSDYSERKAKTEFARCFKRYVYNFTDEEIDKAVKVFINSGKGGFTWITK